VVRVKICGITNWADARAAVDAGADLLGFNFYLKSPRYIRPEAARRIIRRLPRRVEVAGVFVNASARSILRIAREADLNFLQLHADETPETVRALARHYRVIKAFRVNAGFRVQRLERYSGASAFLLDGFDRKRYGGTGKTFDWTVARRARRYGPVVVAGGLTPENVGAAIATVHPFAVDVCGGVEAAPGKKDAGLIRALMAAVEAARRGLL
jgi:phosphoribosylanthranilate isomerase